jgi:hypothetical protein
MHSTTPTRLTLEQSQALAGQCRAPLRMIDPQSNRAYVLLPAELYEHLKALLEDDYHLSDTYAAQLKSAWRAGWDDPQMGDYDHYDENYQKLCQSNEATSSWPTSPSAT